MAAQQGRLLLLSLGGSPTIPIMTARSNDFTINGAIIDVSNKNSNGFRKAIDDGIRYMTVNLEGTYEDEAYEQTLAGYALNGGANSFTLSDEAGNEYSGSFIATTYGRSGTYNGEDAYTVTLESAGEITYVSG